jgi:hypothetical protein
MGKLITNPPKPVVRVKVAQTNYKGILNLALSVQAGLTGHAGFYPSPLPSLVDFGADIIDLQTALSKIGTKFNRGGSANLAAVKNAAFLVFNDLTSLAFYVQEIVSASDSPALQKVQISWTGFATKSPKSRIDRMQFVRNVHQSNSKQFPVTLRRISWRRSLGLFKGARAKAYNVYVIMVGVSNPSFLTTTTKTNLLVPTLFGTPALTVTDVIIKPVNAQGEGNGFMIPVKG